MGVSVWQILIVLAIVLLLFGTKKIRSAGTDLGEAVRGFRHSLKDSRDGELERVPGRGVGENAAPEKD